MNRINCLISSYVERALVSRFGTITKAHPIQLLYDDIRTCSDINAYDRGATWQ